MNHDEAIELAGLYVLDALDPAERAQVDAHLASCPEAHDEFAEVGGVAPTLATLAEAVSAPAALKNRVMADYRAGAGAAARAPAPQVRAPAPVVELSRYRRPWLGWAAAVAAVLLIAVTSGWAYVAQSRADAEAHRAGVLAQAIDIMSASGSSVAVLQGTGSAAGASGFAAFGANGAGYVVVVDLPQAPAGLTYQAWYLTGKQATSAGLMNVDAEGFGLLVLPARSDTEIIALTLEPSGGSDRPTSNPILSGQLAGHA